MSKIKAIYDKINSGQPLSNEEGKYMAFVIRTFKDEMEAVAEYGSKHNPKAPLYYSLIKLIQDERKLVDQGNSVISVYDKRILEYKTNYLGEAKMVMDSDGYYRIQKKKR